MADATLRTHRLHDLSHFGLRLVVGVFFMVHSQLKFGSGFGKFLSGIGLPPEMAMLVGLLELVGGILLVAGVLSRIASALIAIDMLGAIIYVKKIKSFSGSQGIELELLAFIILISIMVLGPGRVSIAHLIKKAPRFLQ
ncbi:MAG TPA: DoxX family protein [Candidatus Nitrosotalea sp.]|nr:DoxX family protein [Candidatus Nitrosotalea sp.]